MKTDMNKALLVFFVIGFITGIIFYFSLYNTIISN